MRLHQCGKPGSDEAAVFLLVVLSDNSDLNDRQLAFSVLWVFDGLLSLISSIDHRCRFCCQANPGGRESGHTGNMGELWTGSLTRACASVAVVVRARCGTCGKFGNTKFPAVGILRVSSSKARRDAVKLSCVWFLLACIVCLTQDTAGSERYEAMSRIYYRGARAAIVCYGKTLLFFKTQA